MPLKKYLFVHMYVYIERALGAAAFNCQETAALSRCLASSMNHVQHKPNQMCKLSTYEETINSIGD